MISMLYFELKLARVRKIMAILLLLGPIIPLLMSLLISDVDLSFLRLVPLVIGWRLIGATITSMKRYRQFESLFSLSVTPKDIFVGGLLFLGIYYIYVFLIYLLLHLSGIAIGSMIELRILFLLALLLMGLKGLASYLAMLISRIYLIESAMFFVMILTMSGWWYIKAIAGHPYVWIVLPISLIAISYLMTTRLSKERIILSSE